MLQTFTKHIHVFLMLSGLLLNSVACQENAPESPPAPVLSPVQAHTENAVWLAGIPGKIVFQSDREGNWEIYAMNVDGSNLRRLTYHNAADEYPVWSPDGQKIAFKSNRTGHFEIYVMDADGQNQRRLSNHSSNNEDPAWSPDGTKIAFHSDRKSNQEIFIMDADGGHVTMLTKGFGRKILPAWSPDGTHMAYTGNRYLGWNVYTRNIENNTEQRLTDGHGACRPDWSPDGQKIAYVSQQADGKGDIWIMNADGSAPERLTPDDVHYDYYPAWSPDGEYLAYAKGPDKETGNWDIYIMTADGRRHQQITQHPARDTFPDWASGSVSAEVPQRRKRVYEAEAAAHTIGQKYLDDTASENAAMYAEERDGAGFLMYGPYELYEPGEYVAGFRVKLVQKQVDEPFALLDIAADTGQTILAQKVLSIQDVQHSSTYQTFELAFSLHANQRIEFRVYSYAQTPLWVDQVIIRNVTATE